MKANRVGRRTEEGTCDRTAAPASLGTLMRSLDRRLKKLEATFTDATGLVPHSPEWRTYWQREIERRFAGKDDADQDDSSRPLIPLEAFRAYLNDELAPAGAAKVES